MKGKRFLSAMLSAAMVLSTITIAAPTEADAAINYSLPALTVDMAPDTERELKHGASGWLYGQGDEQVPTTNTMTALKPHTSVAKAPYGMQHPNGDTLDIAESFLNAGGHDIQIYVPDYYALWFYEFSTTEEYLKILEMEAQACIDKGIAEEVVYVLYNEPFDNWLGGTYTDPETGTVSTGWESLYWFWEDMYNLVVDVYERNGVSQKPRFAGLNLAGYNESVMDGYIKFCVEHSCMPDVISWHDLSTWQFDNFGNEYNHYRSLEAKYLTAENAARYGVDITPREIVINEYAADYECASPGDLVRWIGLFEEYNVSGCMPFWHLSNNLNGIVADNNEGNGAWWLYKWYGDMSGTYLPVTTSNEEKNDFYGAASLDDNKKSANVVFGGINGSANIILDDILNTETFAGDSKVHVKVESTDYTGFHGVAEEPRVVMEGAVKIENGQAVVPVSDMLEMSAYRITVTRATEDEKIGLLSASWKQMIEAEHTALSGNAATAAAYVNMAQSGEYRVGWIQSPSDAVTFQMTVPKDGYYKFDMVYTAGNGCNTADPAYNTPYTAYQDLIVDNSAVERMVLPTTLSFGMGSMYSTSIYLSAGTHTFKVAGVDFTRSADIDCFYLSYQGPEASDTEFDKIYQAETSEFNELGAAATALTTKRDGSVDYVTGLEKVSVTNGGGLRFNAIVPENGMYTLKLRYASDTAAVANIYLDNDAVNLDNLTASISLANTGSAWDNAYRTVFLQKGINVIDIDTTAAIRLDYVNVSKTDIAPTAVVEAESGTLSGEAADGTNGNVTAFASNGGYISGIKAANSVEVIEPGDPEFEIYGLGRFVDLGEAVDKNALTISVYVPTAGEYKMAVYQSSGELFGKHSYNAQMSERYASFSVNGGAAEKVVFRNTYSDETFRSQIVSVYLQAGNNTIKIYNDNSKVVTNGIHLGGTKEPANIDYNVLVNYTPNFDKFEFYPVTAETSVSDKDIYQITAAATKGGLVSANKTKVEDGGSVTFAFAPENGFALATVLVNGRDITSSLNKNGGTYTITNVQEDISVKVYFGDANEGYYVYAVDCGDIDPTTVNDGSVLGSSQSVTDQFFGADPVTGKMWGVVDTYQANAAYPNLLTGAKTWPCENDGATDASSKEKSFRYAKDQATSDVGVVYKFELEAGTTYDVELGFYVPSFWTDANNPRTMKLVFNGTTVSGYENFTAGNDEANPYIIKTQATADANGFLEIQIGHAENAVWGPVVSYINIINNKPEVLADFDFDTDGEYFDGGYAKATGTYTLADRGAGKALSLNGNGQYLTVTAKDGSSLLSGLDEMTVSFWINPGNSYTNWAFYAAANENQQQYLSEKYLGIFHNNGSVLAERFNSNSQARPNSPTFATGSNEWMHVAAVYTASETILYINGAEKARESSNVDISDLLGNNSVLTIGKAAWGQGEYATALIDNYKIYSSALSADAIAADADADAFDGTLLASFDFDTDGAYFDGGNAIATGSCTLEAHDGGQALKLDGSGQFLTVTAKDGSSLLTGLDEMTVSFQISPKSSYTNWGFFAAPSADTQQYLSEHYIGVFDSNGTIAAERYNSYNSARPASAASYTGYGNWYHVTVVYTANETILYINGTEVDRESSIVDISDLLGSNSIVYIGKATWTGNGEYYKGLIDNYKIYGVALTADEVAAEAAKY